MSSESAPSRTAATFWPERRTSISLHAVGRARNAGSDRCDELDEPFRLRVDDRIAGATEGLPGRPAIESIPSFEEQADDRAVRHRDDALARMGPRDCVDSPAESPRGRVRC